MICFPNAKINLGLRVTEKRNDGYHNIETIFYPVPWSEALEIVENKTSSTLFNLHLSGLPINGNTTDNLLYKAYYLIKDIVAVPSIDVFLNKTLPMGAGLGGGSADAAFFINLMNTQFDLGITTQTKLEIAKQLGSDCAFFIENKPVLATQKGDVFEPIHIDLSHLWIAIIYPNLHSNTQDAYRLVVPKKHTTKLSEIISQPISEWRTVLQNDFEESIFSKYPLIKEIKEELYQYGANYASMSGSGSAVFGLFENEPDLFHLTNFPHWIGKLK